MLKEWQIGQRRDEVMGPGWIVEARLTGPFFSLSTFLLLDRLVFNVLVGYGKFHDY
jgi:hypothetical protein